MFKTLARIGIAAAAMVMATTTFTLAETSATPAKNVVAQASPAPTATPNPFSFKGFIRAYDFTRQNASNSAQGGANKAVNQQSFNAGISLHGDYKFADAWSIGGTYFYANPLSGCTTAVSHLSPPCGKVAPESLNPDDTLPGFEMSTLYEAYLQYKDAHFYGRAGNQVYNTPWTSPSDSRLKPTAFQGVDVIFTPNKTWTFQLSDMVRFENRTSSEFDKATLLTSFPAGNPTNVPSNIYVPGGTFLPSNGIWYGRVGYANQQGTKWAGNLAYNAIQNIANAAWLDAKVPLAGPMKPFVALQFGSEKNAGTALIGKIDSTVFGLQAGANLNPNTLLVAGFDTIPIKTDTIVLPAGYSCAANHTIKGTANSAKGVSLPYFLPTGGTGQCTPNANGTTNLYSGGWASPYTDSYATDPLFTTSLTQGMVDRRSPGNAFKLQATFTTSDKKFVSYISQAWYSYNNPAYAQATGEFDADALYFFNKVPKTGSYHGFLARYRYGVRYQSGNANFGGTPLFKYNRFQTEYDF